MADLNSLISQLSELGHDNNIETPARVTPPKTVQKYYETIEKNKKASILHDESQDQDQEITYCISGRGRGGKRAYMAPGGHLSSTLYGKGDVGLGDISDELRQNIRATSGINYSNEYIQDLIRARQAEEAAERKLKRSQNRTQLTESSSNSRSASPGPPRSSSSTSVAEYENECPTSDSKSVSSRVTSPVANGHGTKEVNNNTDKTGEVDTSKGAVPKKPLPLSQILKQSKSKHCKERSKDVARFTLNEGVSDSGLSPLAQPFYPRNVSMDGFLSDSSSSVSIPASTGSSSSSSEYLAWRRRPAVEELPVQIPISNWRKEAGIEPPLNIRSIQQFPLLK